MQYKITWQDVSCGWDSRPLTLKNFGEVTGLSTYATREAAEKQVTWFSLWFPFNKYTITEI